MNQRPAGAAEEIVEVDWLGRRETAIIGCADLKNVKRSGKTALELAGAVFESLLRETGVERERIDGLVAVSANSEATNPFWSSMLADSLGLSPRWTQLTDLGGASIIANIVRAAMAIQAGVCEMALCIAADAPSGQFLTRQTGYRAEFCDPLGYSVLPISFGLLSSAYDTRHGLPSRAMARLAVAQRRGALHNDKACETLRTPLTEEDYLCSRMIASPLRLLDCVMRCDGANAFLVTSSRIAREIGAEKIVHPIAYRELTNFDPAQDVRDITVTGFSQVGPAVLRDAGLAPDALDGFHPYDDFFIAVLLQLEQIGFCGSGQAGAFLLERDVSFSGDFPINSGGGQISAGQPGFANGGVNLMEAARQLRGEAGERQRPDVSRALVTGIGVIQYARNWSVSNALVLERSQ